MQVFKQTVRAAISVLAALFIYAGVNGMAYAQATQTSSEWPQSYYQAVDRNDATTARSILEARVATGDSSALFQQAVAFESGSIYPEDQARAYALFQRAAAAGHLKAMTMVGWMIEYGKHGQPKDPVEALRWYLKAAEGGERAAMNNAGVLYQFGQPGIAVDIEKARYWYEKSVQAGFEPAKKNLASLPAKAPVFVPRPLGPKPEQIALFNTALRAAAQMGFKADSIDNDTLEAQLRHNYQGTEVKFSLSVPVVGRLRGSIRVFDDNIREGFIRLYRQELVKALNGAQIEVDGNISGR